MPKQTLSFKPRVIQIEHQQLGIEGFSPNAKTKHGIVTLRIAVVLILIARGGLEKILHQQLALEMINYSWGVDDQWAQYRGAQGKSSSGRKAELSRVGVEFNMVSG